MDRFEAPTVNLDKKEDKAVVTKEVEFTLSTEIKKVLGGTLEGAFELKGGMGLLITIKKDEKSFALVVQRPGNGTQPKDTTEVYISEGVGK